MANNLLIKESFWQEQFAWFDSWQDKYLYIIEQGRKHAGIISAERSDAMLVKGCQSQVWMSFVITDQRLSIKADSDALIVKGLIAIIFDIYDNQKVSEILQYDHGFAERLGLKDHLSQTRANGLYSMLKQILVSIG